MYFVFNDIENFLSLRSSASIIWQLPDLSRIQTTRTGANLTHLACYSHAADLTPPGRLRPRPLRAVPRDTAEKEPPTRSVYCQDGWILVKQLPFSDSIPGWIPERLVTKPKPGFYRLKKILQWEGTTFTVGVVAREGQIVKAVANTSKWPQITPGYISPIRQTWVDGAVVIDYRNLGPFQELLGVEDPCDDGGVWKVDLLDGSGLIRWVRVLALEAVDVVSEPPVIGSPASPSLESSRTLGRLRSLIDSITRKRTRTVDASANAPPPYIHNKDHLEEK